MGEAHRGNTSLYLVILPIPFAGIIRSRFYGYNLSLIVRHPYDKSVAKVINNSFIQNEADACSASARQIA